MRIEATIRRYCAHCGRETVHEAISYVYDSFHSEEVVFCGECDN